jgi:hypothetical protein
MYYTGIDPFTGRAVQVARSLRDRKMQRALLQIFKAENYCEVRKALIEAGRKDLIRAGCDCLIPARPPGEALEVRRKEANEAAPGDYVNKAPTAAADHRRGYRPGRKSARHQERG